MSISILDIALILILFMFAVGGFRKGAIKEAVSLVGIVAVFVIAFLLKGVLGNLLCKFLPFFDFAGNLEGVTVLNILLYQLVAFIIIYSLLFSVYVIVVKISSGIQKLVNMTIVLWIPSKIIGALIAFVTGYIVIFAVLLVLLIPLKDSNLFKDSKVANYIVYDSPILSSSSESISNSINEIYDLSEELSRGKIDKNEANLQTMDILLKYKIVSPKTAKQLVALDKLDGISGLEEVIESYE